MVGTLVGELAGSPFRENNLESHTRFLGWNFFDSRSEVFYRNRHDRKEVLPDITDLDRRRQRDYEVVEKVSEARPGRFGEEVVSGLSALMQGVEPEGFSTPLSLGVAVGKYARSADEAVELSSALASEYLSSDKDIESARMTAHLVWHASNGTGMDRLRSLAEDYGLQVALRPDMLSGQLKGQVVPGSDGVFILGDGTRDSSPGIVLSSALSSVFRSESYEEAVRRAVALGGDSSLVGGVAGALAGGVFHEVPKMYAEHAVGSYGRDALEVAEALAVRGAGGLERKERTAEQGRFQSVRAGSKTTVYVIPEGREDMESAVRSLCRKQGKEMIVIRPDELKERFEQMSVQRDASGRPLDGTYVECPRPEVKTLWLEDGQIRTSTTRSGLSVSGQELRSVRRRMEAVNDFESLKAYARDVRSELQSKAGYDGPGDVHFASAFYPVVGDRKIDLMEGDVLRGRVRINDDGQIRVDTNVMTGGIGGEYIEGVLSTMNVFPASAGVAELKAVLDEYCLDYGRIEDEQARIDLMGGGQEADAVKMRYASNIDKAAYDVALAGDPLPQAVTPELTAMEVRRAEKVAVQVERSRIENEGISREGAVSRVLDKGAVFTIGHSNMEMDEFKSLLKKYSIDLVVDIRSWPSSKYVPHFNGGDADAKTGKASPLEESLEGEGISYQWLGESFGGRRRRSEEEMRHMYVMEFYNPGIHPVYGVFASDKECNDYCKARNRELPQERRIATYYQASAEEVKAVLDSKACTEELRQDILDYTGKYLTYDEVMVKDDFRRNLKNLRDCVKEGNRVVLMCQESDATYCHRFALLGRALAHPGDGRVKPVAVQHITRDGRLVSQEQLERKMVSAMGLKDDPQGLAKAFRNKCTSNLNRTKDDRAISLRRNMKRK
jgi:hypothetical protein